MSTKKIVAWGLALLFYASILPWRVGAAPDAKVGALTVLGIPTFVDNTIEGADVKDSTLLRGKLQWGSGANQLPRYMDSNAFSDNLTLYGKVVVGDNTGRVQGFSFGSASYTDNGYFQDLITKGPWVDVRAYGAACDNTTADQVAIQAALNTGKDVGIPGLCVIGSGLTMSTPDQKLFALGHGAGLRASAATFDLITIDNTAAGATVDGLTIIGASVGGEATAWRAIGIRAAQTTITNCDISNSNHGITIYQGDAHECQITNNRIKNLPKNAGNYAYGVYTISQRNVISGNQFDNVGRHDVYLSGSTPTGASYNVVSGNTSTGSGLEAIAVYQVAASPTTEGNIIIGNTITNYFAGIGLTANTKRNIIAYNHLSNGTGNRSPIEIEGGTPAGSYPDQNIVVGNTIIDEVSGIGAIRVINSSGNNISKNTIVGKTTAISVGIAVTSDVAAAVQPTGNIIEGNVFDNVTTKVYIDKSNSANIGTYIRSDDYTALTVTDNTASTVDVTGRTLVLFNQTGAMTVTNFTGGYEGQVIRCLFNSADAVTITQANSTLAGSANFVSTSYDTITLLYYNPYWRELGRSVN